MCPSYGKSVVLLNISSQMKLLASDLNSTGRLYMRMSRCKWIWIKNSDFNHICIIFINKSNFILQLSSFVIRIMNLVFIKSYQRLIRPLLFSLYLARQFSFVLNWSQKFQYFPQSFFCKSL